MTDHQKTVPPSSCAEYLGIKERSVYKLMDDGKLGKTYQITGRKQKIREPYAVGLLQEIINRKNKAEKQKNFYENSETKLRAWMNA